MGLNRNYRMLYPKARLLSSLKLDVISISSEGEACYMIKGWFSALFLFTLGPVEPDQKRPSRYLLQDPFHLPRDSLPNPIRSPSLMSIAS